MIDLDDFATGPREWGLIQTAIYYDRFRWHPQGKYEAFTKAYGYDIMQWPGYPVLADIRTPESSVLRRGPDGARGGATGAGLARPGPA
jgi:hypothetical protein